MKKLKFLLLLPLLIIIVACSKNPQDEFITRYNNNLKQEETSFVFSVKIKDIKLANNSTEMSELKDLKNKAFIFDVSQSTKDKIFSISSDLSEFKSSFPMLDIVGTNDDFYVNAELWGMFSGIESDKIKGRYINVADFSEDYDSVFDEAEDSTGWADSFKEIDAEKFKEDGDAVVLTIEMSELLDMVKDVSEDATASTYLNMMNAYLDESSLVTYRLEKDGSANVTIDLKMAPGLDDGIESITIEMISKKVNYIAPKVPSKSKIISPDELQMISSEVYQAELTDEEFQELYNQVKDNLSFYSKEDLMEELEFYRQFLTEEQYKKLEALIATAA
ncbi:hypothetical protein [Streptococcus sp. CSL10205-OR2]|uniref:hypothetical protein n=1 Tax=Streptococcus sp. CSL10205-OR2 TaxID=2980558 RepID=UPI0021D83F6A|nr:hypothetical protein [Streptococcus sp. CSL10205-OR2]MCU9533956.1 hypothetical protein [Streptococcus sp. CSL10205-OR2]